MSDTNQSSKPSGIFSSFGFLAAGMTLAAIAYFFAKPAHQAESIKPLNQTLIEEKHLNNIDHITNPDQSNNTPLTASNNTVNNTDPTTPNVSNNNPPNNTSSDNKLAETNTITDHTLQTHASSDSAINHADNIAVSTEIDQANHTANLTKTTSDAQIFFASGQSSLNSKSIDSLNLIVEKMKANLEYKAILSGYTDSSGNKAQNELLAKNRAKSVRDFLRKHGVSGENDSRIEMLKPETLVGSSDPNQARRVEITLK